MKKALGIFLIALPFVGTYFAHKQFLNENIVIVALLVLVSFIVGACLLQD